MVTAILEIIALGSKIFITERENYFKKQAKKLQEEIYKVEDTDFYHKDMEAKGLAEREIERRTNDLMGQFIVEANK